MWYADTFGPSEAADGADVKPRMNPFRTGRKCQSPVDNRSFRSSIPRTDAERWPVLISILVLSAADQIVALLCLFLQVRLHGSTTQGIRPRTLCTPGRNSNSCTRCKTSSSFTFSRRSSKKLSRGQQAASMRLRSCCYKSAIRNTYQAALLPATARLFLVKIILTKEEKRAVAMSVEIL